MGFDILCSTLIALLFGAAICFGGYRLLLFLLPIWGFFFGLFLGAEAAQVLLGIGFLASVTSWVVGFGVGLVFAVLSYLFYLCAITVVAGSLGYGLGAGFMHLIGINLNLLVFIVGVVVAVVVIVITLTLNLQKYVIILATAVGGAGVVITTLMLGPGGFEMARGVENPIRTLFGVSSLWAIVFVVLAVAGIVVQIGVNRTYELEPYDSRI